MFEKQVKRIIIAYNIGMGKFLELFCMYELNPINYQTTCYNMDFESIYLALIYTGSTLLREGGENELSPKFDNNVFLFVCLTIFNIFLIFDWLFHYVQTFQL